MSQAEGEMLALLTEVESWDVEMCRRQLPSAVHRLLSMYQMSDSWTQHICILRILMERFLPHINLCELEEAFSSKVLPKVIQLFDLLVNEITNYAKGLTIQNVELHGTLRKYLQGLVHVLEALTGCLQYVSSMQESVPLECVQSLPFSFLHIIKNTFIHCKNSELLYSGCLHLFSNLLQSLFKTAYTLQKQLMELLEVVSVNSCSTEDARAIMVSAVHALLEVCSTVSSIDHAVHANTWKFIIRQSVKHKSLIQSNLKHSDVFSGLCENILASFQSCLELAEQMKQSEAEEGVDYKLYQRTVKLCRFFASSLVHYTKEFTPFLAESCSQVYHVYLQIYSKFSPSLYAPVISQAHQDKIAGGFLEIMDTLLSQLLFFKPFLELVLRKISDLSPELRLPQCRLLLSVMDLLPSQSQDVQDLWNTGAQFPEDTARVPLVAALFLGLQQCPGELSLPVFLPATEEAQQAADPLTFYHYACVRLCTFITSLSSWQFHLLECSLLEAVLSSNMITTLLAMDVWCFLARYGTADLCTQHAFVIADLIKACPTECYQVSMLGVLLRRLLFLMAADHQVKFTQKFSPKETENLLLWQHLSLQALVPLLRQQVAHEIFVSGFIHCQEWLSSKKSLEELSQVNTALTALLSLCQTAEETLKVEQRTALVGIIGQFFTILGDTQVSSLPCLQQTICLMFQLLQFFIHMLEPELLIQVFTIQSSLLQLNPQDHVLIAILDFLSSLGKPLLPPDFQIQILSKLPCLFSSLLANDNWLIHQHAMEAFTQFAEETNHEDILPQCLPSEEIKCKVIGFLSKTQQIAETAEARTERMKKENDLLRCHLLEVSADVQKALILEPSPKRTCFSPSEQQYKLAIDNAEGTLEAVKIMLQKGPPPTWLAKRLEALQTTLESLKNSVSSNA